MTKRSSSDGLASRLQRCACLERSDHLTLICPHVPVSKTLYSFLVEIADRESEREINFRNEFDRLSNPSTTFICRIETLALTIPKHIVEDATH
jgi:hypothetical protein